MECRDLERVLRDQEPEALAALAAHAEACPACREELDSWEGLSGAARELRRSWDSPGLWPRIEAALRSEASSPRRRPPAWPWAAAAAVLVIGAALVLLQLRPGPNAGHDWEGQMANEKLINEQVLDQVEDAERAYVRSIDALAKLAEARLQRADSPLLMAYREKLALIDGAIAECRTQIERNRFNAHLRGELLSIYREKQRTLEQLMKEDLHVAS